MNDYQYDAMGCDVKFEAGDVVTLHVDKVNLDVPTEGTRRWCLWLHKSENLFEVVIEAKHFGEGERIFSVFRDPWKKGEIPSNSLYGPYFLTTPVFVSVHRSGTENHLTINLSIENRQLCKVVCPFLPTYLSYGSENVFALPGETPDRNFWYEAFVSHSTMKLNLVTQGETQRLPAGENWLSLSGDAHDFGNAGVRRANERDFDVGSSRSVNKKLKIFSWCS
nr:P30 [Carrot closterovirus 3]